VSGLISPWNLPLYLLTWKIAPAIATGNTCVCKPSEVTPATASILGDLIRRAGLPPGVVNIVHGRGDRAGAALVTHPDVPAISFTGSTGVGKWIGREAGERLKRVSLELGGKNAMIVLEDANLPEVADLAVRAGFTNQGQVCLCTSRLLVHRRIFGVFVDELTRRVSALRVGDPADPATQQGALVSAAHMEKVHGYVELARREGANVHCGGGPLLGARHLPERCRGGYFYAPTVLSGLSPNSRVETEEIFGPVVSVTPFDTDEEALALANGTPYGLASVICTAHLSRAHSLARRVDAGVVWINGWLVRDLRTPFGGMKHSGVGREGGGEALRFFTEPRNVCLRM
jgi:aminomuconate-semialdehyde/2-hydroxymuconate-6-semialdehyde dehydrogenase